MKKWEKKYTPTAFPRDTISYLESSSLTAHALFAGLLKKDL